MIQSVTYGRWRTRTLIGVCAVVLASNSVLAQVDPLSYVRIIPVTDHDPATDDLGFDHYINSTSFKIQSLVTVGHYQFIAYYDQGTSHANRNVTIARRNVTDPTNEWSIAHTAFTSYNSTDAHNVISIGVDADGFLHMSWGMHNNNLLYTRSTGSVLNNSPMSFVGGATGNSAAINTMVGTNETSVTYPNFYSIPGTGDLLFNYRTGSSGNGVYRISKYNTGAKTWSFTNQNWIANTDSSGLNYNAYPHNMVYDSSGGLHASWTFRYNSDSPAGESGYQTNHNLYYGFSPDNGQTWFRDPAGTIPYTGVIDEVTSQLAVAIPEGSSLINTGTMALDREGNPVIATYWAPYAHAAVPDHRRQYMFAYYDDGSWKQSQITNRRVDSPTVKTPESALSNHFMGRPQVLVDDYNRAFVVYNDNEGLTNVTVAVSQAASRDDWEFYELTNVPTTIGADVIELTVDAARWKQDRTLSLFYQPQQGGNASTVNVLEWSTQPALGRVLRWTGNESAAWNTSASNFADQSVPDNFDNFDNILFDDSGMHQTVQLPQNVSAGKVVVDTAQTYVFEGGGMTSGSLAVVGGGTLELRNSGNTYAGRTRVSNATLKILGNAASMRSPIDVATGGTVVLDATDTSTMASSFDVWKSGELRIGTSGRDESVFPRNGNAIVNDGTVRVFSNETLTNVSGAGVLVAEARTLTLMANPAFGGTIAIAAGATVVAADSSAFGTAGLDISGTGSGEGAIRVTNNSQILSQHPSTLRTEGSRLLIASGSSLALARVVGPGGLAKAGAGHLHLNAESSYLGETVVEAGTLTVDGTTGGGPTSVQAAAVLTGRGIIQNGLLAASGSHIRPAAVNVNSLSAIQMIDDFSDGNLAEYDQLTLLNLDNVVESTFSAIGGSLTAGTTDLGNSPEQSALVRPFSGLGLGEMVVVDAALNPNKGTPLPVRIFDYGLLIADSDDLKAGTREKYLYVASRLSSNPDTMLARYWDSDPVDDSPGDVNVNGGAGVNIESPAATQFFIRRTGTSTYQVGYSTDNLQTLQPYGSSITVETSFEPDLVGFYSDPRGGDGGTSLTATSGTFDNLRVVPPAGTSRVFAVQGDFTMEPGAELEMQIQDDAIYSKVVVGQSFRANGLLRLSFATGYVPGGGESFDLLDFNDAVGTFERADLPSLPAGLIWDNSDLLGTGQLHIIPGLAGDYNRSGTVDAADYAIWRKSFGASGLALSADGNGDLRVDHADYDIFRNNFGAALATPATAVPEGGAPPLIGLALLSLWSANRGSRRSPLLTSAKQINERL